MPISRRPAAAHERLTSLAAAPGARPASPSRTGWVPPIPPPAPTPLTWPGDLDDPPARPVVLPFTRPAPAAGAERSAAVEVAEQAVAAQAGRGRHRADPPAGTEGGPAPGVAAALVPGTLRGGRWGVSRRAALGALLALAALATTLVLRAGPPGGGATLVPARPVSSTASVPAGAGATAAQEPSSSAAVPGAPSGAPPGAPSGAPGGAAVAATGETLVVHVVGQVAVPGLVSVADGSRVADALAAAGGATGTADLSGLNLARPVVDGEQLVVPLPGEVVAAPPAAPPGGSAGGGSAGGAPATGPVDLNRADLTTLDGLPGIGPVLAQRILDWRAENGRFTSVDELGEVSGIGDTLLGRLRDAVTV